MAPPIPPSACPPIQVGAVNLVGGPLPGNLAVNLLRREQWRGPNAFDFIPSVYHDAIEAGTSLDDVTDGLRAFALSLGSGGAAFNGCGQDARLSAGLYNFSGPISFGQSATRLHGGGVGNAVLRLRADLGRRVPAIEFRQKRVGYSGVGVGVLGLRLDMNGKTGTGLKLWKPYDGVDLENVYIDNVADADRAFEIVPDPVYAPLDIFSQGVNATNCIGAHSVAGTGTESLWYIESLNEGHFTLCKAFGTYVLGQYQRAPCHGFELVDCSGLKFDAPAAAHMSEHAFLIRSTGKSICRGITIDTPTIENTRGVLITAGVAGNDDINRVLDLDVRSPRKVFPYDAHPSGDFALTLSRYGKFDIKDFTAKLTDTLKNRIATNVGAYAVTGANPSDRIECLPDVFPRTKIEAFVGAPQDIPAGAWTYLSFGNEIGDQGGEYDSAASTFNVQQYGRYRIEVAVQAVPAGAATGQIGMRVIRNGAEFKDLFLAANSGVLGMKRQHSVEVDLVPGDAIRFQFYADMGAQILVSNTASYLRITPINNGYMV